MSPMMPSAEGRSEGVPHGTGRTDGVNSGPRLVGIQGSMATRQPGMAPLVNGVQPAVDGFLGDAGGGQLTTTGLGHATTGYGATSSESTRVDQGLRLVHPTTTPRVLQPQHAPAVPGPPRQSPEDRGPLLQQPMRTASLPSPPLPATSLTEGQPVRVESPPQLPLRDDHREDETENLQLAMVPMGSQPSPEAVQAMARLAEQQGAIVAAVQAREARSVQGDFDPEEGEAMAAYGEEQTVWYERLQRLFQRRVITPMRETAQVVRARATPMSSLQSWYSQPSPQAAIPPRDGSLMDPETRQAMNEWTQRTSLIQPRRDVPRSPADQSSGDSLSPEMVQEEVRRQVQQAMQNRDRGPTA